MQQCQQQKQLTEVFVQQNHQKCLAQGEINNKYLISCL